MTFAEILALILIFLGLVYFMRPIQKKIEKKMLHYFLKKQNKKYNPVINIKKNQRKQDE